MSQFQKHPPIFTGIHQFRNIHRKAPALESLFNRVAGLKTCNCIKRLQQRFFPVNIAKILRAPIFKKICKQLLLQFLLPNVKIFTQGLPSALNSISFFSSRSFSKFKEFSLGCSVGRLFSYSKKRRISQNGYSLSLVVMRCRLLYHSLSFVLTRCHSLSPVVPLVGTRCHSLSLIVPLVVTRWHSLSFVVSLLFQILFLYAQYILYLKMISKNIFS